MAKFEEKYASLVCYQLTEDSVMRAEEEGQCVLCGQTTKFLDPDSGLYFCSEECLNCCPSHDEIQEKDQPTSE